jgi:HEAT repeat protein
MDARTALEPLRATVAQATRRPELLKQSAIALGLLGDKQATVALQQQLAEDQGNLATFAALSNALGLIGDRGSVQPLLRLLADERRLDLSRAFAAVALGGIADRAPMPWYAKVAANLNYRASVETLTNQQSGILDIL